MESAVLRATFEELELQDCLPAIQKMVDHSVDSTGTYVIGGYPIILESDFSDNCNTLIIKKISEKYTDFSDIIKRKLDSMRTEFVESGMSKLYKLSYDAEVKLEFLRKRGNNNYLFKIIVFTVGKGQKSYWSSAGKINVDID